MEKGVQHGAIWTQEFENFKLECKHQNLLVGTQTSIMAAFHNNIYLDSTSLEYLELLKNDQSQGKFVKFCLLNSAGHMPSKEESKCNSVCEDPVIHM